MDKLTPQRWVQTAQIVLKDWNKNYRYHGGISAAARCINGTVKLYRAETRAQKGDAAPSAVDCLTFSIVPKMTALWALLIDSAIDVRPLRVLIGECSGALHRYMPPLPGHHILPMVNYHHGEKLDLLIGKVTQAEYIIVTDDDIFWMDQVPWQWAMEQFDSDPKIAIVSLFPKEKNTPVLKGKVEKPMGSCFIIRREIWDNECLSCKVDHSPQKTLGWIYDTCERAQVTLINKGYRVVIPPPGIQDHFVAFEGISSWTLKIQKYKGDIRENIDGIPIRQRKAMATILTLRNLEKLIKRFLPGEFSPRIVSAPLLAKAEAVCRTYLTSEEIEEIRAAIDSKTMKLETRLQKVNEKIV